MATLAARKAASLLQYGRVVPIVHPLADSTGFDQGDRQHLLRLYRGVLAGVVELHRGIVYLARSRETNYLASE